MSQRIFYFESSTDLQEWLKKNLKSQATAINLQTLPRETENDHRNFLNALMQGFTDGTVQSNPHRLAAVELEMRSRGMLNQNKQVELPQNLNSIEDLIASFGQGRHTLHTTTNQNPAQVEQFIREKSGIALPKEAIKTKLRPHYKRTIKRSI